jgi:hypothetical protein
MPGGTDAMVHAHLSIEVLFFEGKLSKLLIVIQVDQCNMLANLEWHAVRDAML